MPSMLCGFPSGVYDCMACLYVWCMFLGCALASNEVCIWLLLIYGFFANKSQIQLHISTIDLQISTIQLEISPNKLNCRYLQLNCRLSTNHKISAPRRKNR